MRGILVATLSGGLQRRAEVAKALVHEPALLVLDEPSTGLDPSARRDIWQDLARLRDQRGTTVILTTHLMDEAAACDRVAILDLGRLVAIGSPANLTAEVGGDVILLTSTDPVHLAGQVRERFGVPAEVVDGRVRIRARPGTRVRPGAGREFPWGHRRRELRPADARGCLRSPHRQADGVMLLASYTLWLREIVRFHRQRSRIVGALGSPLVFWFLIGSGLNRSFQGGSAMPLRGGYLEDFYPGTLALIVLFTAIFSTISIVEDRQEGFLQGVLVAPVPRVAIVVGKILGSTTLAVIQGLVFLVLAPLAHVSVRLVNLPALVGVMVLVAFGLSGLGFVVAWWLDSTQGFHAIMNVVLIPLWILSGALFPASGAAGWVRVLMLLNPLTYGVSALRRLFYDQPWPSEPPLAVSLAVVVAFGVAMLAAGTGLVQRRRGVGAR